MKDITDMRPSLETSGRPAPEHRSRPLLLLGLVLLLAGAEAALLWHDRPRVHTLAVNATAYTSRRAETQGDPFDAAWGHRLKPGMRVIAVSRDLLRQGLKQGTRVRIEGLPDEYLVLDKMDRRWKRRIDIWFGQDLDAAQNWGVRQVTISWIPERG